MFNVFQTIRKQTKSQSTRRTRPSVETLERRDMLSASPIAVAQDASVTPDANQAAQTSTTPWQNAQNQFDVNNDGQVTPTDALIVINKVNTDGTTDLPKTRAPQAPFFDVNGDNIVSPADVLAINNHLNGNTTVETNSEGTVSTPDQSKVVKTAVVNGTQIRMTFVEGKKVEQIAEFTNGQRVLDTWAEDGTHLRQTYLQGRKIRQQVWQQSNYTVDTWTRSGTHVRKTYQHGRKVMQQTWQRGKYAVDTWTRFGTHVRKTYFHGFKIMQQIWRRGGWYSQDNWTSTGHHLRSTYRYGKLLYRQTWQRRILVNASFADSNKEQIVPQIGFSGLKFHDQNGSIPPVVSSIFAH